MSERLYVGTRKGLFELRRNAAGQWLPMASHFLGEPLSMLLADPRDGALYAALNLGHFGVKLWRRDAGATDWMECAVPVYPPQPPAAEPLEGQAAEPPWSLQQLWILEPGGADRPGTLWAGTIPGGLFRSDDRGASWCLNRELWERPERAQWFGGGYDHPGIHSICVDPRDSRHLTVAVSCGGVWQSHDDGRSWTCTTKGMRADYMPPEQSEEAAIQDPHRLVQCQARPEFLWVQHHNGIFRSRDGGLHWQGVVAEPSSFGFAVAVHPRQPDTAWFVPATRTNAAFPGRPFRGHPHPRRRPQLRDPRARPARRPGLRPGLPPRPGHRPQRRAPGHGLDHRRPVAQRERRGGLAAALRQPAADLLRALRLSARRWTASARLHKFVGFRQGAHPMSLESVRRFFAEKAPDLRIIELETSTATVALAAEAHGVEPGRIAKTLSLRVGERTVLVVARGDARLDNRKIKAAFGGKAKMLGAEDVVELTGHPVGGVCPFGLATPLAVYCDVSLQAFDEVLPAAGAVHSAVRIAPQRMAELVDAQWVDVCQEVLQEA